MIGADFPKIEFHFIGLELMEPVALIMSSVLGGLCVFFAYKVSNIESNLPFYKYWKLFFLFFGVGILLDGVGHTFFNQLGMYGKIQGWLLVPFAIYLSERAMISIHWEESNQKLLTKLSIAKLIIVYVLFVVLLFVSKESKLITQPFLPIVINTIIGFIGFVGVLGFKYTEKLSVKFKYFWLGVMILIPTAIIFLMKVNLHLWFNKNDFSLVIFCVGITYFYLGVNGLAKGLKQKH